MENISSYWPFPCLYQIPHMAVNTENSKQDIYMSVLEWCLPSVIGCEPCAAYILIPVFMRDRYHSQLLSLWATLFASHHRWP